MRRNVLGERRFVLPVRPCLLPLLLAALLLLLPVRVLRRQRVLRLQIPQLGQVLRL